MKRLLSVLLLVAGCAQAQTFPSKPVRWIVPFPPGGATDIIARIVAAKMGEAWKEPVVVENRAGAAGAIGSEVVARAAPDGHTILMGTTSTHAVGPAVNSNLPYNHLADFAPVTTIWPTSRRLRWWRRSRTCSSRIRRPPTRCRTSSPG
jgi:tripartite-type tricarboxylate transporter receptor subunit TctC